MYTVLKKQNKSPQLQLQPYEKKYCHLNDNKRSETKEGALRCMR